MGTHSFWIVNRRLDRDRVLPTRFVSPMLMKKAGSFLNCSAGEHERAFALWQHWKWVVHCSTELCSARWCYIGADFTLESTKECPFYTKKGLHCQCSFGCYLQVFSFSLLGALLLVRLPVQMVRCMYFRLLENLGGDFVVRGWVDSHSLWE